MIPLTLAQIAAATGGRVHPPAAAGLLIDGPVVSDSRQCGPGGLYVARIGERADGHDFAAAAAAAGARAALTTRELDALPCVVLDGAPGDLQDAFGALATAVIDASPGLTVIGLTGSSGKTTTKDLLAAVLATAGPTVATVGSLNSEVGVPLTVCRSTPATRFLVLEMGSRGIGHIRFLAELTHPRIGAVLNIGSAHAGEFGGMAVTARAKGELVEALPADGVAVLNADDPLVAAFATRTRATVVTFSASGRPDATVRAADVRLDAGRARFTLITPEGSAPVALGVLGAHQVDNALAVAAVARAAGMPVADIAAALGGATIASRYRMEVTERPDGITIVNDAYNANPESMAAALATLPALATSAAGARRRTWAVLGEMLELGADSAARHRELGTAAARAGVDRLVAVGAVAADLAAGVHRAAGEPTTGEPTTGGTATTGPATTEVTVVAGPEEAEAFLREHLVDGDVVLLKASNSIGLWSVADRLAAAPGNLSEPRGESA